MLFLVLILSLSVVTWANTEAYGFQVPNYYEIPIHNPNNSHGSEFVFLNETSLLLRNHPILSIDNYSTNTLVLSVPYNFTKSPRQKLYVKLNNYNNNLFDSNDLINVKLCWPATTPINFRLSHRFIQEKEFTGLSQPSNTLDIYVVVDYEADFYALEPVPYTDFEILLVISKLPNKLPIPIELYDVIAYVIDIMILAYTVLPWILDALYKTMISP